MITIYLVGMDPYLGSQYSLVHQKKLAKVFMVHEEEILFQNSDSHLYFKGVDQFSYQVIFRVFAPSNFSSSEKEVAAYLAASLKGIAIHVQVEFFYFNPTSYYEYIDEDYPRFIQESNQVKVAKTKTGKNEELYQGNIFAEVEKKMEEAREMKEGAVCHNGICEGDEGE